MSTRKTTTTTTTRKRNKNTPKKGGRKVNNKMSTINHSTGIHISPCTRMYAKALVNPFAVQGLPCIPDNIVLPSFKFSTKARGVFSTGTVGFGYVVIDPFQMLASNGTYNAVPLGFGGAIYYTDKTYTQAGFKTNTLGVLDVGVNIANSNSLFVQADFDTGIRPRRQFRLVGCGIRISYIGSNLYNAGRLIIWRNQGNQSIDMNTLAVITPSTQLQDQYTSISTVSRSSKYVYYVPDDPEFIAYNRFNEYAPLLGVPAVGVNHHSMGIFIDGGSVAPNQQSWEFEAVAFFESVGEGLTLSKSDGDPVGHDIIMSSLPNIAPTSTPQSVENSVISSFMKGFSDTTREVAYTVGRKAIGYAASSAMNYYNNSSKQLYLMPS